MTKKKSCYVIFDFFQYNEDFHLLSKEKRERKKKDCIIKTINFSNIKGKNSKKQTIIKKKQSEQNNPLSNKTKQNRKEGFF